MKTNLKRFSMFFISQTVSQMGSSMTSFALIIWAYSNTGQVMSSSILAICSKIPYIIISLFGGTIADRVSKKKIMLICDLIAALCSLSILIFSLMNILHLWILCIINIIIGFMNAFQNPASQITVSLLVEKEDYVRIGGIQSVVNSMVGLGTPLIAAGILSIGGLNLVIIIDLCTFCFAFFSLLCWIKIPELKNIEKGFSFEQIIDDMRECGKFIKTQKGIVWLMIIYSILNFLGAISFDSMMSPLLLARTNNNTLIVGSVSSSAAAGGIIASVIITFTKTKKKKKPIMFGGILLAFLGIMSFGIVRNPVLWCIVVFIGCFGMPFYFTYESAIMRLSVPIEMQGRIFALKEMITQVLAPIGYLLGALLADYIFEPFMQTSGSLKKVFEKIVGTGPGSGMGLLFVIAGIVGIIMTLVFYNNRYIKLLDQ